MILFNKLRKAISNKISMVQGGSLKAQSARGSLTLAVGAFFERGINLVRNMILARLLAPQDFGLMALVLSVLVVLESFTDVGVQQAIIQHKDGGKEEYLNIVWWIQILRGLCLYIITFLIAPLICQFYGKPELLNLLRVSFIVVIFNGFTCPRLYLLDKEFKFAKALFLMQGSSLIGTTVAIILVFYMQSVWILVIAQLVQAGVQCLFSHILCPFRPTLNIDRRYLKEILSFGHGMAGLSFLTIVSLQTDIFVLAKLLSSEQVGMYALARSLAQQPELFYSRTIGRILLPMFAKKQDDRKAIRCWVIKMLKSVLLCGVPLLILVALGSRSILSVIYGAKYSVVAVTFTILCFTLLFRILKHILGTVYIAIGKPYLHRRFSIVLVVFIVCLIYPATVCFGLVGAATVLLLSTMITVLLQILVFRRTIML